MPTVEHVLLTRFNLPSGGVEARIRASDAWLERRVALFARYCAPSVAVQAGPRPRWIVYLDPESPGWLVDALSPYVDTGLFTPLYRAEVPPATLRADLRAVTRGADLLVTTNLDNDDGLAVNFSERVRRAAAASTERRALYLTHGLIKGPEGVYARTDRVNAFCSVVEPARQPVTCWADWHNRLSRHMPVTELGGPPAWLQVIHGTNVSNRVRGRLVSPSPWTHLFPFALDDMPLPRRRLLVHDRLVRAPLRSARDVSRALVRRAAVATLGKEGLQSLRSQVHG
ncbi:glycosyltransferase [Ornithinimicrobium pekingense]|uniref:Rhamnosyltransferase n=1 Tax=Ornithinimicrobium pekingense TaxID=384677 RepID=A0ABQ2F9P5_9MICO|nr:glycosyltransferase [Ornithinimicrobium pekingense]GGK71224.1 hypothetical protein GCM10011509_19600 [Ornithinimicrobium pekingense]